MKEVNTFGTLATPRSRYFKYYEGATISSGRQPISSGGGQTIVQDPSVILGDTYANLQAIEDPKDDVIYITRDTDNLYIYDSDNNQFINIGSAQSVVYFNGTPTGQGETNKFYIDTTNKVGYFWNGSAFVQMAGGSGFNKINNQSNLDIVGTLPRVKLLTDQTTITGINDTITVDERFKYLQPGTNLSFDESTPGYVTINASGGSSDGFTGVQNISTLDTFVDTQGRIPVATRETSLAASGSNVVLREYYKFIVAGSNVTFSESNGTVTISASGGGGTSGITSINGATNTSINLNPGTNITITRIDSSNIQIDGVGFLSPQGTLNIGKTGNNVTLDIGDFKPTFIKIGNRYGSGDGSWRLLDNYYIFAVDLEMYGGGLAAGETRQWSFGNGLSPNNVVSITANAYSSFGNIAEIRTWIGYDNGYYIFVRNESINIASSPRISMLIVTSVNMQGVFT